MPSRHSKNTLASAYSGRLIPKCVIVAVFGVPNSLWLSTTKCQPISIHNDLGIWNAGCAQCPLGLSTNSMRRSIGVSHFAGIPTSPSLAGRKIPTWDLPLHARQELLDAARERMTHLGDYGVHAPPINIRGASRVPIPHDRSGSKVDQLS
jgi:hypothetical protein